MEMIPLDPRRQADAKRRVERAEREAAYHEREARRLRAAATTLREVWRLESDKRS